MTFSSHKAFLELESGMSQSSSQSTLDVVRCAIMVPEASMPTG